MDDLYMKGVDPSMTKVMEEINSTGYKVGMLECLGTPEDVIMQVAEPALRVIEMMTGAENKAAFANYNLGYVDAQIDFEERGNVPCYMPKRLKMYKQPETAKRYRIVVIY